MSRYLYPFNFAPPPNFSATSDFTYPSRFTPPSMISPPTNYIRRTASAPELSLTRVNESLAQHSDRLEVLETAVVDLNARLQNQQAMRSTPSSQGAPMERLILLEDAFAALRQSHAQAATALADVQATLARRETDRAHERRAALQTSSKVLVLQEETEKLARKAEEQYAWMRAMDPQVDEARKLGQKAVVWGEDLDGVIDELARLETKLHFQRREMIEKVKGRFEEVEKSLDELKRRVDAAENSDVDNTSEGERRATAEQCSNLASSLAELREKLLEELQQLVDRLPAPELTPSNQGTASPEPLPVETTSARPHPEDIWPLSGSTAAEAASTERSATEQEQQQPESSAQAIRRQANWRTRHPNRDVRIIQGSDDLVRVVRGSCPQPGAISRLRRDRAFPGVDGFDGVFSMDDL